MRPTRVMAPALLALAVAFAALVISCGGDGNGGDGAAAPNGTPPSAATPAGGENGDDSDNDDNDDNGEVREIVVSMQDNFFEPNEIRIEAGETVRIVVNNEGTAIHNMIISTSDAEGQNFQSDAIVNPGESSEFEVTVQTPGSYQFFCSFHLPDMVGTLIVE